MPEGLKDAEKCIELDPTLVKGYTRKGAVQYLMREYGKTLELLDVVDHQKQQRKEPERPLYQVLEQKEG